jgi:CheY-specific phosphatase CheX
VASPSSEVLARCVGQMLEEATYLFAAPADVPPPPFSGTMLEARLDFSGKEKGVLSICTDEEMAAELAANLLGEEPSDPEIAARGREALGELVNMVVGALVVDLFGHETQCRLGVPVIRTLDPKDRRQAAGDSCSVVFLTEEGRRLDVSLQTTPAGG